jgi:chromosomal replication initiation ATPase DnaA
MELIIKINLETKYCEILSISQLNHKDIISTICNYFHITYRELTKRPLKRKDEYVLCRQFISYYLNENLDMKYEQIADRLNYLGEKTGIVSHNITTVKNMLETKDAQYTRTFDNLERIFKLMTIKK